MTDYDPDKRVPNYIKQWVIAIRRRAKSDTGYTSTSPTSRTKLIIEITLRLKDRMLRKDVLQAITGLPLQSQNQLTQGYTSILIDEVINVCKEHPDTIAHIENLLKSTTGIHPWDLFPWEKPQVDSIDMPEMQDADPPF